jgi:hypothetical protein
MTMPATATATATMTELYDNLIDDMAAGDFAAAHDAASELKRLYNREPNTPDLPCRLGPCDSLSWLTTTIQMLTHVIHRVQDEGATRKT